jgi:hypothetical protein
MTVGLVVEDAADGQDRAAQVGQEDNAVALVSLRNRVLDHLTAGPQLAFDSAGGDDAGFAAGDLSGQVSKASSQFRAVRNQHYTDHFR